ncbi:hypothetical protein APF79_13210 [bacterium BRH_c32]|nr:MAG: hypothetical protein APF79_13210 [bacterium BRH_c32]
MKEKLIYIVIFLFAFIAVSGGMYYAAGAYKDVFAFDFSPADHTIKVASDTTKLKIPESPKSIIKPVETEAKIDSLLKNSVSENPIVEERNPVKLDSLKLLLAEIKKLKEEKGNGKSISMPNAVSIVPDNTTQKVNTQIKKDSTYNSWMKNSIKLYESMDTKKAAKIIQGYSDNIAREILFSMKKKKAAEIISELKPEAATRIMNLQ